MPAEVDDLGGDTGVNAAAMVLICHTTAFSMSAGYRANQELTHIIASDD